MYGTEVESGGIPFVPEKRQRLLPAKAPGKAAAMFAEWQRKAPRIGKEDVERWIAAPPGSMHILALGGASLAAKLDSLRTDGDVTSFGFEISNPPARFQATLRDSGRLRAELLFEGESLAYAVDSEPDADGWKLHPADVSQLLCSPPGTIYGKQLVSPRAPADPAAETVAAMGTEASLPLLNSLPGAPHVIYCDFDGEVVSHPKWAGGAIINATAHPNSSDAVFVSNVWKRVSEDFSPFAINVTTDRAVFDATPTTRRVHCIVTATSTAAPGSGGVAYLSSFGDGTPCWCFNLDEYSCADTISHEVGHTLGLHHDGRTINGDSYYGGHGSGATSWAPIMGASWSDSGPTYLEEDVTQWSRGEYPDANNTEDDLEIITGASNGFGYREDDKGSTQATATPLKFVGNVVADQGVMERNTDADLLSFTTSGGLVTLNVAVTNVNSSLTPQPGANLAVALQLLDSGGSVLQSSNPTSTLGAGIAANLAAGNYFLKISGAARGTISTGFTNYASLGQYAVAGTVPQTGISTLSVNPSTRMVPSGGGTFSFDANSNATWSWAKDASWVTSAEAASQTGSQTFTYTVGANTGAGSRTATINLTGPGGLTAIHQIQQQGATNDDHGNTTATATAVAPNSTTAGSFEIAGDEDYFRIVAPSAGTLEVETAGSTDTYGYLLDSAGATLAQNDDSADRNFRISHAVSAGTYYVRVRHYSSASIGIYQLVSKFTVSALLTVSPPSVTVPASGGDFSFNVASNAFWTWSDDAAWVVSSEVSGQSGSQLFEYTISPNTGTSSRNATITLVSGGLSATHIITQGGTSGDDHGDDIASATAVGQNSSTAGIFETGGDLDYFRIVVTSSGRLTVGTTGSLDTYGTLFDSNGISLATNDDDQTLNFLISWPVTPGTYYVEARHYSSSGTGSYQFTSQLDNDPVLVLDTGELAFPSAGGGANIVVTSNITWSWVSDSTWLTSSEAVSQTGNQTFSLSASANTGAARSGTITFSASGLTPQTLSVTQSSGSGDDHGGSTGTATPIAPNSSTSGVIEIPGDNDYFSIVLPSSGLLDIRTTGSTDTYGYLLDSSGNELTSNDDSADLNFGITRTVSAGTYYVRVRGYGTDTGSYTLVCSITEGDDHGDSTGTATLVPPSSTTDGYIEVPGDNDYFRIDVPGPGSLDIHTTGSTDTFGYLLDASGNEIASNDDSVGLNFGIIRTVSAGTYYVRIRGFGSTIGSYAFVSSINLDDDHGDSTATATQITPNSTTGGNIEISGDNDYFRIVVLGSGSLDMHTTGSTDTFGYLLDASGNEIASNDDSVGLNFGITQTVSAGTYYVRVRGFGSSTGAYALVASFSSSARELYAAAAAAAGLTGSNADAGSIPYGDGVSNLLKYAFNMNLSSANAGTLVAGSGTTGLPLVTLEGTGQTRTLKVEYLRRKNSGLLYTAEWSATLIPQALVPMNGTTTVSSIDASWERVVIRQAFDTGTTPRAFATVEVILP